VILSIFFLGGEKRLRHTASLCFLIPKVDAHAGMMYILSSPAGTSPNVFSCVRSAGQSGMPTLILPAAGGAAGGLSLL
jgi:hypothetical protein